MGSEMCIRDRATRARNMLEQNRLAERVIPELEEDDRRRFYCAQRIAHFFGMDIWDVHFRRQQRGIDSWFGLTCGTGERADQVLTLARQQFDLAMLASGPTMETIVSGANYTAHSALDTLVTRLAAYPGKGWDMIAVALRSPARRTRISTLKTLKQWGFEAWPEPARAAIEAMRDSEPDKDIRAQAEALFAVRPS